MAIGRRPLQHLGKDTAMKMAEMYNNRAFFRQQKACIEWLLHRSAILVFLVVGTCCSQIHAQSYLTSTGSSGGASPYPAEMGVVDAASGNLHLEIPLGSFPQRGGNALVPKLLYDSHIWTFPTDGSTKEWTTQGALFGLAYGTWGFSEGGSAGIKYMKASGSGCNID